MCGGWGLETGVETESKQHNSSGNIFPAAPSAAPHRAAFKWVMEGEFYVVLTHVPIECWEAVLTSFKMKAKMTSRIDLQSLPVIVAISGRQNISIKTDKFIPFKVNTCLK